jgi:hypothetical protein
MNGTTKNATPAMGVWLDVTKDCPLQFVVRDHDMVFMSLGHTELKLTFDAETLRWMVERGAAALEEMDQRDDLEQVGPVGSA